MSIIIHCYYFIIINDDEKGNVCLLKKKGIT